jgi:hypothetical protein
MLFELSHDHNCPMPRLLDGVVVQAMAVCAVPAAGCMLLGLAVPGTPDMELGAVWLGLTVLMSMRAITIYLPWKLQISPFQNVFHDIRTESEVPECK